MVEKLTSLYAHEHFPGYKYDCVPVVLTLDMRLHDKVAVVILICLWLVLDIAVIMVDKDDDEATHYWTNQVWAVSVISKLLLTFEIYHTANLPVQETVTVMGWFTSCLFLVIGSAQAGVLGAFFALTWLDSTLLDTMLQSDTRSIAEVIVWNHVRHVSVCFIHLAIVWSMREYLSYNANAIHELKFCMYKTSYSLFVVVVTCTPIIAGFIHSGFFNDQEIYMYKEASTGFRCQIIYTALSLIATMYFLRVPLMNAEADNGCMYKQVQQQPTSEPVHCTCGAPNRVRVTVLTPEFKLKNLI